MSPLFTGLALSLCLLAHSWAIPLGHHDVAELCERGECESRVRRDIFDDFAGFAQLFDFLQTGIVRDEDIGAACTACKAAADTVEYLLEDGMTDEEAVDILYSICTQFKIMSEPICSGFSKNVGPEIVAVLNATNQPPIQICSFLLGDKCGLETPGEPWTVTLPDVPKPPLQTPTLPPNDIKKLRVLQISDTHIDMFYEAGTASQCQEPLCCRAQSTPQDNSPLAGRWGDYKCDIPMETFDNMLQQAATTHKDIDYILWTGDIPAHDLWDENEETVTKIIRATSTKIREAFPGIPVYPAIGNHDSSPVNSFPGPEVGGRWNISWLYDVLLEEWGSEYINTNETSQTIRRGAFYSTPVRPGLRIISLNMNYCYLSNWWLIVNSTDPAQELYWLANELQKSETRGEKVHIVGHIPPGRTDCLKTWSIEYIKIINRYEDTVKAQFFGHTHHDEFEVYYDMNNGSRPVSISFIGGSVTSYTDVNPGYRIYDVDGARNGATGLVLDSETWMFDIDEANRVGEPQWRKSYTMREAFGLPSLLPQDLHHFWNRLRTDTELMQLYYKYHSKESPDGKEGCHGSCVNGIICGIRSCNLYPDLPL